MSVPVAVQACSESIVRYQASSWVSTRRGAQRVHGPSFGTDPEVGGGDCLFVVEDLGVGEAGAVIERSVDEPVADTCVTAGGAGTATVEPPAAAVRDAGDLLDVNVDQLTRTFR